MTDLLNESRALLPGHARGCWSLDEVKDVERDDTVSVVRALNKAESRFHAELERLSGIKGWKSFNAAVKFGKLFRPYGQFAGIMFILNHKEGDIVRMDRVQYSVGPHDPSKTREREWRIEVSSLVRNVPAGHGSDQKIEKVFTGSWKTRNAWLDPSKALSPLKGFFRKAERLKPKGESIEYSAALIESKTPVFNPYGMGMWVIRVEDYLYKVTGKKWTWKKPILTIEGGKKIQYKWVGRKKRGAVTRPIFTATVEYKKGPDAFDIETEYFDGSNMVASKTHHSLYIEQAVDPQALFGWVKRKWSKKTGMQSEALESMKGSRIAFPLAKKVIKKSFPEFEGMVKSVLPIRVITDEFRDRSLARNPEEVVGFRVNLSNGPVYVAVVCPAPGKACILAVYDGPSWKSTHSNLRFDSERAASARQGVDFLRGVFKEITADEQSESALKAESLKSAGKVRKGDNVRLEVVSNRGRRVYEVLVDTVREKGSRISIGGKVYKKNKKTGIYSITPSSSYASVDVYTDGKFENQVVISGKRGGRVSAGTRYKLVNMSRRSSPPHKDARVENAKKHDAFYGTGNMQKMEGVSRAGTLVEGKAEEGLLAALKKYGGSAPITDLAALIRGVHYAGIERAAKKLVRQGKLSMRKDSRDGIILTLKEGAPGPFAVSDNPPSIQDMVDAVREQIKNPSWTYPHWALPKVQLDESKVKEGQRLFVHGIEYEIVDAMYDNEIGLDIVDKKKAKGKYGIGGKVIITSEPTVLKWLSNQAKHRRMKG